MPSGAEWEFRLAAEACRDPETAIFRWKSLSGRKAAGCIPFHMPEEILHAAGMLPVTVWGNEFVPYPPAGTSPSGCSLAEGVAGAIRSGRWEEIDAWAFPADCAGCRVVLDSVLSREGGRPRFPFSRPLPPDAPGASEDMLDRVEDLREWAGRVSGRRVSDGGLEKSVRAYNRNRNAFSLLEETMRESPGSFSGAEFLAFARAGMVLPKEAHTEILEAALSRSRTAALPVRAKVFLAGLTATSPVLEALDATGAALVGNDLAAGHRYYSGTADETGDIPLALARRRMRKDACDSPHGQDPGLPETLFRRYAESGADRLILLRAGPGEAGTGRIIDMAKEARNRGIAFLCLDIDREDGQGESAMERITSFIGEEGGR